MNSFYLTALCSKLESWFEKYFLGLINRVGNTNSKLALLVVVLIFFTGGDALVSIFIGYDKLAESTFWQFIVRQSHDLLTPHSDREAYHHTSKMTYRLLPPLLAKLCFNCNLKSTMYFLVSLEYLSGFLFFFISIKTFKKYIADLDTVSWVMLGFAFIFLGKIFFWDTFALFDAYALLFLLSAMTSEHRMFQFIFLTLAFWTDERALIATPLIWIWLAMSDFKNSQKDKHQVAIFQHFNSVNPKQITLVLAIIVTIIGRGLLDKYFHFPSGIDILELLKEAKINLFTNRLIELIPFVLFSSFESYWLIILLSLIILWKENQRLWLFSLLVSAAISLGTSLMVYDITRSIMYSFPLLFIAIRIVALRVDQIQLKRLSFYVFLFAMIFPTYYLSHYIWPFFIRTLRF